jgi:hypothetical protein
MTDDFDATADRAGQAVDRILDHNARPAPSAAAVAHRASQRHRTRVGLATAAVLVVVGAGVVRARTTSNTRVVAGQSPTSASAAPTTTAVPPTTAPVNCQVGVAAHPDYAKVDPNHVRAGHFPPADPPPAGTAPLTEAEAIAIGRRYQDPTLNPHPDDTPATAAEMRYADYIASNPMAGSADPYVNPDRCVWVVTVEGRILPMAPPIGTHPVPSIRYQVVLDAGTHYGLGVSGQGPPVVAAGAFADTWRLHTNVLTINADGTGFADWRTYRTCGQDAPPCDTWTGNVITDGGHATFHLTTVTGNEAKGIVDLSSDPAFLAVGPLTLSLTPDDLLVINGRQPGLCGTTVARQAAAGTAPPGVNCGA